VRVGLVSPYSWSIPGGVNDHIANLAAQLQEKGHEAWIMAPTGSRHSGRLSLPIPEERFVRMGTALPIPSNGSKAYVNPSPLLLWHMEKVMLRCRFDVLHAHEPCTPSVAGAAVLRATSPVVGTFHAALESSWWYNMLFPVAKRIVEDLAVKIAVSEAAREYPEARFPGEYRIIPNGVAVERYAVARDGVKVPGRILFVGRAEPRKGLAHLLRAFVIVRREMPNATLQLAGPRWDQVLSQLPRPDNGVSWSLSGVNALGWVEHDAKVAEMAAAEVLCVPSTSGESFGIVLAEGLAAGVPVVASDLPGYRAVLCDGKVGVLVPPRDPEALAEGLLTVLRDGALRRRLYEAGVAAVQEYSWTHVADRVIAVYDEAIALRGAAADAV
jgi:phosphatidylinositol alpha-mannosyltransferase